MRRLIAVGAFVALGLGVTGSAMAAEPVGPSGSTFDGTTVTCGHTNTFLDAPVVVYNGYNGLEVCSDTLNTRAWVQSNYVQPIFLPDYVHADVYGTHALHLDLPF
jgi:hypothetical protein